MHPADPCNNATPVEHARLMPSVPLLTSEGRGWRGVTVQRYRLPPTVIDFPAGCDHRISMHLSGPTLFDLACNGRRERRWSDGGYSTVVPAGLPVNRSMQGRPDLVQVYVAPAMVDEVATEAFDLDPARVRLVETLFLLDATLDRLCRLLLAEAEAGAPGGRLLADMLARALAVHLLRRYSSHACQPPDEVPKGAMVGWRLRRVLEHMEAHLTEDLPLAQLAMVSGIGASQFARAFRAATGEPPHRYLVRLRVERACGLLERTRLAVTEVGLRCGFEQPSHFATLFRKHTGLSPRAYRTARCT